MESSNYWKNNKNINIGVKKKLGCFCNRIMGKLWEIFRKNYRNLEFKYVSIKILIKKWMKVFLNNALITLRAKFKLKLHNMKQKDKNSLRMKLKKLNLRFNN